MREIQELTLNLNRGLDGLKKKLLDRSNRFKDDKFQRLKYLDEGFGIRMTAVPVLDEVNFNSVYQKGSIIEELSPPSLEIQRTMGGQTNHLANLNDYGLAPSNWRPMLRATGTESFRPSNANAGTGYIRFAYSEISRDGLLKTGFLSINEVNNPSTQELEPFTLDSEIPVSMFAQLIEWADKVRNRAHVPMAEYAIEIEITAKSDNTKVEFGADSSNPTIIFMNKIETNVLPLGTRVFPLYPLVEANEKAELVALFERDFWNFLGKDLGEIQGCLKYSTIN